MDIISLQGDYDLSNAEELKAQLAESSAVTLDMSAVTFLDSTAVDVLVETARRGAQIKIVNPSRQVARVLTICSLHERFISST